MKVLIDKVIVRARHRERMGDINSLARSIEEVGLLHPIVITPSKRLICGQRRILACKQLGWSEISATEIDLKRIIAGESAENTERLDLTPTEAVAVKRALEPLELAKAKDRQKAGQKAGGKTSGRGRRKKLGAESAPSNGQPTSKSRAKAARATGKSHDTLSKAEAVVQAAEENPEKFGDLPAKMNETGKVDPVYRELQKRRLPPNYKPKVTEPNEVRRILNHPTGAAATFLKALNKFVSEVEERLEEIEFDKASWEEAHFLLTWAMVHERSKPVLKRLEAALKAFGKGEGWV